MPCSSSQNLPPPKALTKSGHCEYFAAATTLLLRAAGIPARYATGFAVLEYTELEGAHVVRARHAHARTRAWVGGRWVDVDNTPPVWFGEEARLAPAWERLADLFRWASYRWAQRTGFELGIAGYLLLGVLAGVLIWRLARAKRASRSGARTITDGARAYPGCDSEFYDIERALLGRVPLRQPGTALGAWASTVACTMDEALRADLEDTLQLHTRLRFDPDGLDERERARLRNTARRLVETICAGHALGRDGSPPGKEPRRQK